ncbi:hypothetical protein CSUI_008199, partial [Cystoisospora suis]
IALAVISRLELLLPGVPSSPRLKLMKSPSCGRS